MILPEGNHLVNCAVDNVFFPYIGEYHIEIVFFRVSQIYHESVYSNGTGTHVTTPSHNKDMFLFLGLQNSNGIMMQGFVVYQMIFTFSFNSSELPANPSVMGSEFTPTYLVARSWVQLDSAHTHMPVGMT